MLVLYLLGFNNRLHLSMQADLVLGQALILHSPE